MKMTYVNIFEKCMVMYLAVNRKKSSLPRFFSHQGAADVDFNFGLKLLTFVFTDFRLER